MPDYEDILPKLHKMFPLVKLHTVSFLDLKFLSRFKVPPAEERKPRSNFVYFYIQLRFDLACIDLALPP